MKLTIDLDMNKIDYESINKQIQEQIAALDITTHYEFEHKIQHKIDQAVDDIVADTFRKGYRWGTVEDASRKMMEDSLNKTVRDYINEKALKVLNEIPEEELNKLINELLPLILVERLKMLSEGAIMNSTNKLSETIEEKACSRIANMLCNRGIAI